MIRSTELIKSEDKTSIHITLKYTPLCFIYCTIYICDSKDMYALGLVSSYTPYRAGPYTGGFGRTPLSAG